MEIAAGAGAVKRLAEVKGDLDIRDVNFSYPQRPKVKVLRGFSLQARAGQTVALVGASGNGKSTVVGLIERWYDVTGGQVNHPRNQPMGNLVYFLRKWS